MVSESLSEKPPIPTIRPMSIVPGVNAVEVYWLCGCVFLSVVRVLGITEDPRSIVSAFERFGTIAWYASLGIGSGLAFIGGFRKKRITDDSGLRKALLVYAVGWSYAASASMAWGLSLLFVIGGPGVSSGIITFLWGLAGFHTALRSVKLREGEHYRTPRKRLWDLFTKWRRARHGESEGSG